MIKKCETNKAELRMLKARHAGKDMDGQLRAYYNLSKNVNLTLAMAQAVRNGTIDKRLSVSNKEALRTAIVLFGKKLLLTAEELQEVLDLIKAVKKTIESGDLNDEDKEEFLKQLNSLISGNDKEDSTHEELEDTEIDPDLKKDKDKKSVGEASVKKNSGVYALRGLPILKLIDDKKKSLSSKADKLMNDLGVKN